MASGPITSWQIDGKTVETVADFIFLASKITAGIGYSPTSVFLGFPCGSAGKESACDMGDLGSIPGLGRSPGEGTGYPLQYSGLENSLDCMVHGVAESRTRLSDFDFTLWAVKRGTDS